MLPSKFGINWPFSSGEEAKNRFSRWLSYENAQNTRGSKRRIRRKKKKDDIWEIQSSNSSSCGSSCSNGSINVVVIVLEMVAIVIPHNVLAIK